MCCCDMRRAVQAAEYDERLRRAEVYRVEHQTRLAAREGRLGHRVRDWFRRSQLAPVALASDTSGRALALRRV